MRILSVTATRIGDAAPPSALPDHLMRTLPGARNAVACGLAATRLLAPLAPVAAR
ncbi:hypothetical protein [Elioraea sp.]|uniref:hypothetical protein n=1 Tax=Elioraea sp. TaxID=2185103 RepID=UPI003F70F589